MMRLDGILFIPTGKNLSTVDKLNTLCPEPFSLSLQPFEYPVCTVEGVVFDLL